jgi:hypothetical protein
MLDGLLQAWFGERTERRQGTCGGPPNYQMVIVKGADQRIDHNLTLEHAERLCSDSTHAWGIVSPQGIDEQGEALDIPHAFEAADGLSSQFHVSTARNMLMACGLGQCPSNWMILTRVSCERHPVVPCFSAMRVSSTAWIR